VNPVFPDIIVEVKGGVIPGCPTRPCPQAISVDDPGLLRRQLPPGIRGLRVFDPNRTGPDNKPGTQAAGAAGDLAFALQSRTDRAIAFLNVQPAGRNGDQRHALPAADQLRRVNPGDPFNADAAHLRGRTSIRVKTIAGSHEEEHNMTRHGLKWLQGAARASAPRPIQGGGTPRRTRSPSSSHCRRRCCRSSTPRAALIDYAYAVDFPNDGFWVGIWA
jgi:hypothetical protein